MRCHAADRRPRFGSAPFAARAHNDAVAGSGETLRDLQADATGGSRDHGQTAGLLRVGTHGKMAIPGLRSAGSVLRTRPNGRRATKPEVTPDNGAHIRRAVPFCWTTLIAVTGVQPSPLRTARWRRSRYLCWPDSTSWPLVVDGDRCDHDAVVALRLQAGDRGRRVQGVPGVNLDQE